MSNKERLFQFFSSHPLMVISTVDANGKPQSAVVGFGQTEKLELFFGTSNTTRKYKNLNANSHVAAVIGWEEATVQYEGEARELVPGEELEQYKEAYYTKSPSSRQFGELPDERFFLITPKWIRYTDVKTHEVFEITL
ncbi:hypothetical protein C5B42_04220 [Candidatus Cerribacteria bacterium 'Amazon FNV 2010 28 9']|uniref:Pyridoxamine 5'-phosphate oxidase N-terminal domain-containing protein n=1 Tax=Candidatus Cerribacteria bacterium 'Amazon FNV 2010 28 9' TaxID=2081795 RepID=A0A317JT49_9BACT|nr:MAG: hypothetical protein C5B42_04220 [Candidatus Cerribacteria bacterium 'Amazon FNV 2010 28 9']